MPLSRQIEGERERDKERGQYLEWSLGKGMRQSRDQ